ncbi:MAG: hypothetical protein LUE22_04315 [Oscillospiraceae bacterium]|nr:hypothetical protein [Oscillospiraceae bacterium]
MSYKAKHINQDKDVELLCQCKWIIDKTVHFHEFTICDLAEISAPEGKMVTMLVNGTVVDMKPGKYSGNIDLIVSDEYVAKPASLMKFNRLQAVLASAICVENDKIIPEKSVLEAVHDGTVTNEAADGVYIAAAGHFNGIIVNNGKYAIRNSQMDMEGFGFNDYIGADCAVTVHGNSDVEISNCEFNMSGVTRCAVHAGGNSTVAINNCKIINMSPASDWLGSFTWQLPFRGTNRLCQTADNAHVTYNNCHLKTNGWGIVSVDGVDKDIKVDFNDCYMEATGPQTYAYGSFCIGPCTLNFNHTVLKANGFPIICMCDEGEGFVNVSNGTEIIGRRFGLVSISDGGTIAMLKDSKMDTKLANFLFRGSHTSVTVDNCQITSESKQFINMIDDVNTDQRAQNHIIPVGVQDIYVEEHDLAAYDEKEDIYMHLIHTDIVGDAMNATTNIRAYKQSRIGNGIGKFHDTMTGLFTPESIMENILAELPEGAEPPEPPDFGDPDANKGPKNLVLKLTGASVTGIISSATSHYREGLTEITPDNCHEINDVTMEATPTVNNGVILELDGESRWIVTGTSYITKLTIAADAVIEAVDGSELRMTVDGVITPITAGEYVGKIVIEKI